MFQKDIQEDKVMNKIFEFLIGIGVCILLAFSITTFFINIKNFTSKKTSSTKEIFKIPEISDTKAIKRNLDYDLLNFKSVAKLSITRPDYCEKFKSDYSDFANFKDQNGFGICDFKTGIRKFDFKNDDNKTCVSAIFDVKDRYEATFEFVLGSSKCKEVDTDVIRLLNEKEKFLSQDIIDTPKKLNDTLNNLLIEVQEMFRNSGEVHTAGGFITILDKDQKKLWENKDKNHRIFEFKNKGKVCVEAILDKKNQTSGSLEFKLGADANDKLCKNILDDKITTQYIGLKKEFDFSKKPNLALLNDLKYIKNELINNPILTIKNLSNFKIYNKKGDKKLSLDRPSFQIFELKYNGKLCIKTTIYLKSQDDIVVKFDKGSEAEDEICKNLLKDIDLTRL